MGARADSLVLATVKSFFGSRGVASEHVAGGLALYALLNNPEVREGVIASAADRYGYQPTAIELRFYVGRFAGRSKGVHEREVRQWCASVTAGAGPIRVFNVNEVVDRVLPLAELATYRDNAALVALKVLREAKKL